MSDHSVYELTGLPRWKEPMNPYRSPLPEEFKDEAVRQYEVAIESHEELIRQLRDRVVQLESENEGLKWRLASTPKHLMRPPVISFMGFHMESADVD